MKIALSLARLVTKVFVIQALVLFLMTGCISSPPGPGDISNYKEGVSDVDISLLQNAPPREVYPGSDFRIIVRLKNSLGYDAQDVSVALAGNFEKYISLSSRVQKAEGEEPGALKGRSLERPEGEEAFVEFDAKAGSLFLNAEEQQSPFIVKVSYQSALEFADTICINPNLYATYDSGCTVQSKKSYNGQGAPLVIASLEEITLSGSPGEVEFRLRLKDRGNGRVTWAELISAKVGAKELRCSFELDSGKKRIFHPQDNGEALLICRLPIDDPASYATAIALQFTYSYEASETQQLKIVNVQR